MGTVRAGTLPALLIVDAQVGVMRQAWDVARIVGNIAQTVERARARQVPVIWVQHADQGMAHGSADWQWVPELVPAEGEARVYKSFESSFEQTVLEQELARLGASHITLAGASTNWCIRATAYAALERGYDLTLVQDAHTTASIDLDDGSTVEAASVVQDLNLVMRWLTYPGRSNRIVTAAAVEF
ncbi:MAG: isochorismatase family protein [Rubrivivax sp.]